MSVNNPGGSKKHSVSRGVIVSVAVLAIAFGLYFGLMRMYPAPAPAHPVARGKIPPMPPSQSMPPASGPSVATPAAGQSEPENASPTRTPAEAEQVHSMDAGHTENRAAASREPVAAPAASTVAPAAEQPAKEETPAHTASIPGDSSQTDLIAAAPFTIQVGSYRNKNNADRQAALLRNKGIDAYLYQTSSSDQQPWYLVRFGHFESFDAATQALASFKNREKMEGAVKRLHNK